uniref:Uncharacterized protein n=1 Tax=Anser cygnoides TaxID=8845 RepID=A0A8B9EMS3_ANSCY
MRPCWVLLLLLLAPAGAVSPEPDTSPVPELEGAVTAGPEGSVPPGQDGSLPPTRPWRWPSSSLQAVLAALRLLHRGSPGPCALRLRVLQPRPGRVSAGGPGLARGSRPVPEGLVPLQLGVAQRQQELTFLVQDAWCQPTGMPPTACRSCRPQPGRSWGAWIRERWASLRQRLRERGPPWTRGRRSRTSPARP